MYCKAYCKVERGVLYGLLQGREVCIVWLIVG